MIVAVVRFSLPTPMTVDEAAAVFEASAPSYQNIPGLHRKHYLLAEDGHTAGGVYLWESRADADALYDDAWRAKLTARYGAPPSVELFHSPVTVDAGAVIAG
jgi:Putative mono-oxygenase ydhR